MSFVAIFVYLVMRRLINEGRYFPKSYVEPYFSVRFTSLYGWGSRRKWTEERKASGFLLIKSDSTHQSMEVGKWGGIKVTALGTDRYW